MSEGRSEKLARTGNNFTFTTLFYNKNQYSLPSTASYLIINNPLPTADTATDTYEENMENQDNTTLDTNISTHHKTKQQSTNKKVVQNLAVNIGRQKKE